MDNEIMYARLEEKGGTPVFMAGINLETIARDARIISPHLQVVVIDKTEIPEEYNWSILKVERSSDWRGNGTYLLIRNFQEYGRAFGRFVDSITFN